MEGLKAGGKVDDYQEAIGKCNRMEYANVDTRFVNGDPGDQEEGEVRMPFDQYIIAEGEWSNTTKRLGFDKMIDKFAQAIGLVINMAYNKDDPQEKKLESCKRGYTRDQEEIVKYEFMEYLKGETHYFVFGIKKQSLLEHGVLREDRPSSRALLQTDNLDIVKLKDLARKIATKEGLPESTEFYPHNPVQLFDFSSRARCLESCKLLRGGVGGGSLAHATKQNITEAVNASGQLGSPALVMPIGDALLEPFWPQGLGSNRGFHTAVNAAWTCTVAREKGLAEAAKEQRFAYQMILMTAFHPRDLMPQDAWTADPTARFVRNLMGLARGKLRKECRDDDDVPDRIIALPMTQFG